MDCSDTNTSIGVWDSSIPIPIIVSTLQSNQTDTDTGIQRPKYWSTIPILLPIPGLDMKSGGHSFENDSVMAILVIFGLYGMLV